jgi:predicted metal-dependent phosphoesterase TrpH
MHKDTFTDLHIHSRYSDGTLTPEEIYTAARDSGVGVIAVADHDVIEGNSHVRALCSGSETAATQTVSLPEHSARTCELPSITS